MIIDTKGRILIFATSISLLTLLLAEGLNVILFPAEILHLTMKGTAVIVVLISFPTCLWVGWHMRERALIGLQLQTLVNRDRLTDAATRDFFFEQLAASPNGYGVSLMVDIDHFKRVNDTYGHLAGDLVIQLVADVMRANVRPNDIVCRFGGEEFVVFLSEANQDEGWQISERIRHGIEAASTPSDQGNIKVTVSVGGSLKDRVDEIETAIARADACLYRAKTGGRNRTVVDWRDDGLKVAS